MRATGLTKQGYVRQLSQWLDLRYASLFPRLAMLRAQVPADLEYPSPFTGPSSALGCF